MTMDQLTAATITRLDVEVERLVKMVKRLEAELGDSDFKNIELEAKVERLARDKAAEREGSEGLDEMLQEKQAEVERLVELYHRIETLAEERRVGVTTPETDDE